ncbi:HNH endonuclease [Pontibacter sp. G13]|uniref:HNH endonuclease n=1 Tax=Pontibacter sp. G13 TaxID=3074898 RepID=UPI00288B6365|nr:HNH endonuclease [Pontibacter sp. G13]WNJ21453.1 HNH endonuclease [Pontibacter sp. G13]
MVIRESVLVLNSDYQAIGVCSVERAFILMLLSKAEMLSDHPEKRLRTVSKDFVYPSIIRLYKYVHFPYKRVNLSRHNVFKRDGYRCVYCGTKEDLTIDHVIPKSSGGRDTWDNLVTACQKCNSKKGSLPLEQTDLTMRHEPFRPSFVMFLGKFSGEIQEDWKPYLYMS